MGILSKRDKQSQNNPGEHKPKGIDVLFALSRRNEQRMTELESKLSTIRRDLNRLDRMVYRETEAPEDAEVKRRVNEYGSFYVPPPYKHLFGR